MADPRIPASALRGSASGLTSTTCFFESFLLRSALATGWEKDNVRCTLPKDGSSGRNRSAYPVVPFARVSSLYQQEEARPGDHVAESLVGLDVSRLGLGPALGVHARQQRGPSINAQAAGTGVRWAVWQGGPGDEQDLARRVECTN